MSLWDALLAPEPVTAQLRQDASSQAPTHAWLFTGGAGSLNRQAASVFAATLLCDQPDPADRGCGTCRGVCDRHERFPRRLHTFPYRGGEHQH